MELTEYLNSEDFKKHKENKLKLVQYTICYYLLFKEDFDNINDLINRINDDNIDSNFTTIICNKLMSKNANKKEIYARILSTIGNLKYELVDTNDTDYFDRILDILKKYNIDLHVRPKTLISSNLDKIIACYDKLDSKIISIANLIYNKNEIFYNNEEYTKIRNDFYKYLKDHKVDNKDIIAIIYLLDSHYYNINNEIIVSNNIDANEENLNEITKKYKSDINIYLKDLLKSKRERKGENKTVLANLSFQRDLDENYLINYIDIQEKYKKILREMIKEEEKKKDFLKEDFEYINQKEASSKKVA